MDEDQQRFLGKVEKQDLARFINTEMLDEQDKSLVQQLRKLMPSEVSRYLDRNSPFSGIWENIVQQHNDQLPEETRTLINEYLHPKIKKLFEHCGESLLVYTLPEKKQFVTANLESAELVCNFIAPYFEIQYAKGAYEIECRVKLPLADVNVSENECTSPLLFKYHQQYFTWKKSEDILMMESFLPSGKIVIRKEEWAEKLQTFVLPLSKMYHIHFGNVEKEELNNITPEVSIHLKERGDYLLFQPVFSYQGFEVRAIDKEKIIVPLSDKILMIQRNLETEARIISKIESLHSGFVRPEQSDLLALKGAEVLKNNWFFLFVDAVKDMSIPVFGFEALKNFRFNTAKPSTKIFISSNTDWFDAKVEIHFGEQKVSVEDVKKALASKQQFVPLQDGTLGILPEEWIKKYSLLFRVGEGRSENIKLSKYHFSVIEELYLQRDEEELFFQLEENMSALKKIIPLKMYLHPNI